MRKQFVSTVENLLENDPRVVLLLGDIGVHGFRNASAKHRARVHNLGILEQASVSLAAGLAKEGFVPIFHSIAPFVVERAFEQIKVDFGYQNLPGVFVSVGGSYDYASLGCTHHCPGDIALMKTVPNLQVFAPGSAIELDQILKASVANGHPSYVRLSERPHDSPPPPRESIYQASVQQIGGRGTIVAVGPNLPTVFAACKDLDVTILYYTALAPFDRKTLADNCPADKLMIVEPFYEGTLSHDIQEAVGQRRMSIRAVGVPRRFLTQYGKAEEHDVACGLTREQISKVAQEFFHEC